MSQGQVARNREAKDIRWLSSVSLNARLFSTCGKRQYYAQILDKNGFTVSTGYNGGPSGTQHCNEGGCPRFQQMSVSGSDYDNCIAIHAEANALLHSDFHSLYDGTMIVNGTPCLTCAKLITNSRISALVFIHPIEEQLHAEDGLQLILSSGIALRGYDADIVNHFTASRGIELL